MRKSTNFVIAAAITLSLVFAPAAAYASDDEVSSQASSASAATSTSSEADNSSEASAPASETQQTSTQGSSTSDSVVSYCADTVIGGVEEAASAAATKVESAQTRKEKASAYEAARVNKILAYDPAAIEAIGNQMKSGHFICCPSYACAYADAIIDGTVRDHSYYTCECCTWPDWGGGASSSRNVGTDEQVLREAYDQIAAGKPTVVHVSWSGGEHWIALIGYENATDPDHLTLANFIALDPADGAQINAASKYALFGDGCQHVSTR